MVRERVFSVRYAGAEKTEHRLRSRRTLSVRVAKRFPYGSRHKLVPYTLVDGGVPSLLNQPLPRTVPYPQS